MHNHVQRDTPAQPSCAPSAYIKHVSTLSPNDRVLAAIRLSTPKQRKQGRQKRQKSGISKELEQNGVEVVDTYFRQTSAKNPYWLMGVAEKARQLGCNKVVFSSTNRIIRPNDYDHRNNQDAPLTISDLEEMAQRLGGIEVYTVMDPDASEKEQQLWEKRCAGKSKHPRGSYIDKQQLKPLVLSWAKEGLPHKEIRGRLNNAVSLSTVYKWLEDGGHEKRPITRKKQLKQHTETWLNGG